MSATEGEKRSFSLGLAYGAFIVVILDFVWRTLGTVFS